MNALIDQLRAVLAQRLAVSLPTEGPRAHGTPEATSSTPEQAAGTAAPFQTVEFKTKGYHLNVVVTPDQVVPAAKALDELGFAMDTVTGVDWMAAGEMEVVYDFIHFTTQAHVVLRTRVPRANPEVPTISGVFPGANWHERETHEFFGIRFTGHPNLSPLLLPEDATYHPLRKDFACAG